jgi:hypothetical protein
MLLNCRSRISWWNIFVKMIHCFFIWIFMNLLKISTKFISWIQWTNIVKVAIISIESWFIRRASTLLTFYSSLDSVNTRNYRLFERLWLSHHYLIILMSWSINFCLILKSHLILFTLYVTLLTKVQKHWWILLLLRSVIIIIIVIVFISFFILFSLLAQYLSLFLKKVNNPSINLKYILMLIILYWIESLLFLFLYFFFFFNLNSLDFTVFDHWKVWSNERYKACYVENKHIFLSCYNFISFLYIFEVAYFFYSNKLWGLIICRLRYSYVFNI